jgi:Ca2+-binding RTX toxin-like protein
MSKTIITGSKHSTIKMNRSDSSWIVDRDAVVSVHNNGSAVLENAGVSGNTFVNNGQMFAGGSTHTVTAYFIGDMTDVTNAKTGKVTGETGFRLQGDHQTMVNDGLIKVTDDGITVYGDHTTVTNNGRISASNIGVDMVNADHSSLVNSESGRIAADVGISFSTDTGISLSFKNLGQVNGGYASIQGGAGDEKVVNRGTLAGDVNLFDGNDVFDARKGTLDGKFYGGDGDDTLITDSAGIKFADAGDYVDTDTVKSTVSYKLNFGVAQLFLLGKNDINGTGTSDSEVLAGNSGDNIIKGMGGSDAITGGKGNDRLSGGSATDTFIFRSGDGADVITNFNVDDTGGASTDILDISNWKAIADFTDLMDHHVKQVGSNTVIFAGADRVTLEHVDKSTLTAGDFVFMV